MLSAHESYTLDDISYHNLISYLESMTPFEAVRQAEEINKVNGFEVVNKVAIAGWKRGATNHFRKIEFSCDKADETILEKKESEMTKAEYQNFRNEKSDFKNRKLHKAKVTKREYQKAYMKMIN